MTQASTSHDDPMLSRASAAPLASPSDMFPIFISRLAPAKIVRNPFAQCISFMPSILYDVRRSACLAPFLPIPALRETSPYTFCSQLDYRRSSTPKGIIAVPNSGIIITLLSVATAAQK